jgi:hypothetical protein
MVDGWSDGEYRGRGREEREDVFVTLDDAMALVW